MHPVYTKYSKGQISKVGNTIIYLSEKIGNLSKTKLLKLLYILDEVAVKKSGIPLLNLHYDVWKFGPVDKDIYIELSSEPNLLKDYIRRSATADGRNLIVPKLNFAITNFQTMRLILWTWSLINLEIKPQRNWFPIPIV